MLLGIFDNDNFTYSNLLFKRRRINTICLSIKKTIHKTIKSQSTPNLNSEKELRIRKLLLLTKLIKQRKNSAIKIQSHIRKFLIYKKIKKFFAIKELIEKRKKNIILIQNHFKTFLIHKHFKNLLENEALFFYKFPIDLIDKLCLISNSEKLKEMYTQNKLNLSMQLKSPKINFNFEYSKYLDCYYIPIKKIKLFKKHILINFQVNGEKILDPRYSIINDTNGNFYNIITSNMIYRKNKEKSFVKNKFFNDDKQWEKLFILKTRKRSFSFDASSISSKTDISKELNKNLDNQNNINYNNNNNKKENKQIHSILKNNHLMKNKKVCLKKVTFSNKIEFYN